jgi:serine/threonine protein kinase
MSDVCLIYELAQNGSLDNFWKDDEGRVRLSAGKTRIKIAYQVAKVLRYMHEGLDWEAVCFHRDIKSATICLNAQFDALVIDCGLSKYIVDGQESMSSAGTKGYICPSYNEGDIVEFESACDVFSFGVFLCELLTGTVSLQGQHHYTIYGRKSMKSRELIDDVDALVDWSDEEIKRELVVLALRCMKTQPEDRPSISEVVEMLEKLHFMCDTEELDVAFTAQPTQTTPTGDDAGGKKCRTCGVRRRHFLQCGGSGCHIHCSSCLEEDLKKSLKRRVSHKFTCLKQGCNSPAFEVMEVVNLISPNVWQTFLFTHHLQPIHKKIDSSIGIQNDTKQKMDYSIGIQKGTNQRIDTSLRIQAQLCSNGGNKCPRRFLLVPADKAKNPLLHPREWAKNLKSDKFYLYFVCSHSNAIVSDDARFSMRCTPENLRKIAPAWNVSLFLLGKAAGVYGFHTELDAFRLNEMDEWVTNLLEPKTRDVLQRARNANNVLDDAEVQTLVGEAFSLVAEKASESIKWQNELREAFDFERKEATYIKPAFTTLDRYTQWRDS